MKVEGLMQKTYFNKTAIETVPNTKIVSID